MTLSGPWPEACLILALGALPWAAMFVVDLWRGTPEDRP